ncbi:Uncharacterised protein [Citrobacter freundii]|nr:Uncharacterised protein [Citrobacter freundii]
MSGRFPVEAIEAPATLTDYSGVTTAGKSIQIMPANPSARLYRIQNLSQTESLWFNDAGGEAAPYTPSSYVLLPGSYYEFPGVLALSVYANTIIPFSAARY